MFILSFLLATSFSAGVLSYTCKDDNGCELLGSCVQGTCVCARGFTGPSCGSVDLAPVPTDSGMVWPKAPVNTAKVASSWGFTVTYDPSDEMYHAVAAVACGGAGVIAGGGGNSFDAHLVSTRPDGDFELVSMFTPQTTFGPHLAVAPDGAFVLVFRVNVLNNTVICAGNGSDPMPSLLNGSYIPPSSLHSGNPEVGTSIYIAWAEKMSGPWNVVQTNITDAGNVHKSNPSIQPLANATGDAQWIMGYRYNEGGEYNAIAIASDFRGPWRCIANITNTPAGGEDPFIFQQPGQLTYAHILFHNQGFGYHSWGPIDGSSPWLLSPTQSHAFTLNATFEDGSVKSFQRRERPEIAFRSDGTPAWLYNGVLDADGTAYSFVQPIY
jgi:hypothetical protein